MTLKRKISEDEISQTFNLKTYLGKTPTAEQKELFYELAVEKMVDRTVGGDDVNNKKFLPYEPDYAKAKGVPVDSVDLVLSGDMLQSFDEESQSKDHVKIEMASDQTGKAYGHLSGFKGHPNIKKKKKRDFFGFKRKDDLEEIIKEVKMIGEDDEEATFINAFQEQEVEVIDLAELRQIVQGVDIEFEDL
jgi:hypothetical protein